MLKRSALVVLVVVAFLGTGCGTGHTRTVTVHARTPTTHATARRRATQAQRPAVTRPRPSAALRQREMSVAERAQYERKVQEAQPSGIYGLQSRRENEEAGCRYGFTVSGEETKCNTQAEGQQLQRDHRHQIESGQVTREEAEATAQRVYRQEQCRVAGGVC